MKKLFLLRKSLFIAFAAATCGLFSIIGCAAQKSGSRTARRSGRRGDPPRTSVEGTGRGAVRDRGGMNFTSRRTNPRSSHPPATTFPWKANGALSVSPPDLFPKTPLGNLTITDDSAEITLEKRKKNGDIQFCMRMTGPANSQDRKVIITLYKDTDKCHVQVSNELLAYPVVKFTGVVRPAGE